MSKRNRSRNIIPAVWLIGLGILWMFDLWWPGILILIGITLLINVLGVEEKTSAVRVERKEEPETAEAAPQPAPVEVPPAEPEAEPDPEPVPGSISRLPKTCPMCGGPVDERKVKWLGPEDARCQFCDSKLPLGLV